MAGLSGCQEQSCFIDDGYAAAAKGDYDKALKAWYGCEHKKGVPGDVLAFMATWYGQPEWQQHYAAVSELDIVYTEPLEPIRYGALNRINTLQKSWELMVRAAYRRERNIIRTLANMYGIGNPELGLAAAPVKAACLETVADLALELRTVDKISACISVYASVPLVTKSLPGKPAQLWPDCRTLQGCTITEPVHGVGTISWECVESHCWVTSFMTPRWPYIRYDSPALTRSVPIVEAKQCDSAAGLTLVQQADWAGAFELLKDCEQEPEVTADTLLLLAFLHQYSRYDNSNKIQGHQKTWDLMSRAAATGNAYMINQLAVMFEFGDQVLEMEPQPNIAKCLRALSALPDSQRTANKVLKCLAR